VTVEGEFREWLALLDLPSAGAPSYRAIRISRRRRFLRHARVAIGIM
jgi:hypothetical protein